MVISALTIARASAARPSRRRLAGISRRGAPVIGA
jgi:hypothetical protein